jgi:hypothetical protein
MDRETKTEHWDVERLVTLWWTGLDGPVLRDGEQMGTENRQR